MPEKTSRIKLKAVAVINGALNNSHLVLAALLFAAGIEFLRTNLAMISGAMFGAGASLLGAWINELTKKRSDAEEKARREVDSRRYLAPELNRTIERVLYIHGRATANFISASVEHIKPSDSVKPNDLREDFLPYMPVLYPNTPQFRDLSGDDATALISFYDSLHELDKFVNDWWKRDGQLPVNIFNGLLMLANNSMELAETCIQRFELEKFYPPKYESWGTLSSRIERSKKSANQAHEAHMARHETKK